MHRWAVAPYNVPPETSWDKTIERSLVGVGDKSLGLPVMKRAHRMWGERERAALDIWECTSNLLFFPRGRAATQAVIHLLVQCPPLRYA